MRIEGLTGGRYPWADDSRALVVVLDRLGSVRDASPAMAELLGYPLDDLIGLPLDEVVHPNDIEAAANAVLGAFVGMEATGRGHAQLARVLCADGTARRVMTTTQAAAHPDDPAALVMLLEDVSDTDILVDQLAAHLRMNAMLQDVSRLRRGSSEAEGLAGELALARIGMFIEADKVEWWILSAKQIHTLAGSWVKPSHRPALTDGVIPVTGTAFTDVVSLGLSASGTIVDTDGEVRSYLASSSGRDEHVTGLLCAYGSADRMWTDVDRRSLGSVEAMLVSLVPPVVRPAQADSSTIGTKTADRREREAALLAPLLDDLTMGVVTFSADRVVLRMNALATTILGPIEGIHLHNLRLTAAAKEELNLTFESGELGRFAWTVGAAAMTSTVVPRFTQSRLDEVTWLFQPAETGGVRLTNADLAIAASLRALVIDEQISLRYQPEVDARTGRLVAFEALAVALLDGVELTASAFVPMAEASGLITEIDRLAMTTAVRQTSAWRNHGWDDALVRLNASAQSLNDQAYAMRLERELRRAGLDGRHLCVELTESDKSGDEWVIAQTIRAVSELGVGVAIDDFGVAQATFARLSDLDVSVLKLDARFATGVVRSDRTRTVVDRTVRMAHDLGCVVVAEGIETEQQRELMTRLGADRLQGFLIGRPMNPADIDITALTAGILV